MASESISAVLLRRWHVVLAGLLLTIGLSVGVFQTVPATYEAQGTELLLPPAVNVGDNPYIDMTGLGGLADVIATRVTDAQTSEALLALGATGTFTIARDQTTSAPILLITAKAKTAADALRTATVVRQSVVPALAALQDGVKVPARARVTASGLAADEKATPVRKAQIRAVAGVAMLGILLTLILASLLDRLALRRRQRPPLAAGAIAGGPGRQYLPGDPQAAATRPVRSEGRVADDFSLLAAIEAVEAAKSDISRR